MSETSAKLVMHNFPGSEDPSPKPLCIKDLTHSKA